MSICHGNDLSFDCGGVSHVLHMVPLYLMKGVRWSKKVCRCIL